MEFVESSNEQHRQLIDAQQVFGAWLPASSDLARMGDAASYNRQRAQIRLTEAPWRP